MIEYVIWFFVIALAISVGIVLACFLLLFICILYANYQLDHLF